MPEIQPLEGLINLEREFSRLLASIGSWHVLRTHDRSVKCSCRRHTESDQADPACVLCEGAGSPFFEWPVRAYQVTTAVTANLNASELFLTFASLSEDGALFYIESKWPISMSDWLYQVALDRGQQIILPLRRLGVYNVVTPVPMRGDRRGAFDYWMVYAVADKGKRTK